MATQTSVFAVAVGAAVGLGAGVAVPVRRVAGALPLHPTGAAERTLAFRRTVASPGRVVCRRREPAGVRCPEPEAQKLAECSAPTLGALRGAAVKEAEAAAGAEE